MADQLEKEVDEDQNELTRCNMSKSKVELIQWQKKNTLDN